MLSYNRTIRPATQGGRTRRQAKRSLAHSCRHDSHPARVGVGRPLPKHPAARAEDIPSWLKMREGNFRSTRGTPSAVQEETPRKQTRIFSIRLCVLDKDCQNHFATPDATCFLLSPKHLFGF